MVRMANRFRTIKHKWALCSKIQTLNMWKYSITLQMNFTEGSNCLSSRKQQNGKTVNRKTGSRASQEKATDKP